jgi:hypothetical protein
MLPRHCAFPVAMLTAQPLAQVSEMNERLPSHVRTLLPLHVVPTRQTSQLVNSAAQPVGQFTGAALPEPVALHSVSASPLQETNAFGVQDCGSQLPLRVAQVVPVGQVCWIMAAPPLLQVTSWLPVQEMNELGSQIRFAMHCPWPFWFSQVRDGPQSSSTKLVPPPQACRVLPVQAARSLKLVP